MLARVVADSVRAVPVRRNLRRELKSPDSRLSSGLDF